MYILPVPITAFYPQPTYASSLVNSAFEYGKFMEKLTNLFIMEIEKKKHLFLIDKIKKINLPNLKGNYKSCLT